MRRSLPTIEFAATFMHLVFIYMEIVQIITINPQLDQKNNTQFAAAAVFLLDRCSSIACSITSVSSNNFIPCGGVCMFICALVS